MKTAKQNLVYNETRDRYLEILWAAQKVEDQRLVAMIRQRLGDSARDLVYFQNGCAIFPFPYSAVQTAPVPEPATLWPKHPMRQVGSFCFGYCLLILLLLAVG